VAKSHLEEGNDRTKILILFCGDEDPAVQRAASGALAILASEYPREIGAKIIQVCNGSDSEMTARLQG